MHFPSVSSPSLDFADSTLSSFTFDHVSRVWIPDTSKKDVSKFYRSELQLSRPKVLSGQVTPKPELLESPSGLDKIFLPEGWKSNHDSFYLAAFASKLCI